MSYIIYIHIIAFSSKHTKRNSIMKYKDEPVKIFNIRLPQSVWAYLKLDAIDKGITMHAIALDCLIGYKNKKEKKLEKKLTT